MGKKKTFSDQINVDELNSYKDETIKSLVNISYDEARQLADLDLVYWGAIKDLLPSSGSMNYLGGFDNSNQLPQVDEEDNSSVARVGDVFWIVEDGVWRSLDSSSFYEYDVKILAQPDLNLSSQTDDFLIVHVQNGNKLYFASKQSNLGDFEGARIFLSQNKKHYDLGSVSLSSNGYDLYQISSASAGLIPNTTTNLQVWFRNKGHNTTFSEDAPDNSEGEQDDFWIKITDTRTKVFVKDETEWIEVSEKTDNHIGKTKEDAEVEGTFVFQPMKFKSYILQLIGNTSFDIDLEDLKEDETLNFIMQLSGDFSWQMLPNWLRTGYHNDMYAGALPNLFRFYIEKGGANPSGYYNLESIGTTPFIATFDTTKTVSGGLADDEIVLPLSLETPTGRANYFVDWGDGKTSMINGLDDPEILHKYDEAGVYDVEIFPIRTSDELRISQRNSTSEEAQKLVGVKQYGDALIGYAAFADTINLSVITAEDEPRLDISIRSMFNSSAVSHVEGIENWNTGNVTDMRAMFYGASNFNQPIGDWNTGNVTNMQYMFYEASNFNQPIEDWNTGNVTNMQYMFQNASYFNQPIGDWNTGNVTNMQFMFYEASNFNQPIGDWNTGNVTNMQSMFNGASNFNQPIGDWNTGNVTNMQFMFYEASNFNQPIGDWNTGNVTDMRSMFARTNYNQDLTSWDVSKVTSMSLMFWYQSGRNQDFGLWNFNINVSFGTFWLIADQMEPQYIDSILIKLESIMIGSGRTADKRLIFSNAKRTSASDEAYNNLIADGWNLGQDNETPSYRITRI